MQKSEKPDKMAVRSYILILLLLLTSSPLCADVLDAVSVGVGPVETQQANRVRDGFQGFLMAFGPVSAEFRHRQTVQDWLFRADQNLLDTLPMQDRGAESSAAGSSDVDVLSGNSAVSEAEIQPFLLIVPRSGYREPVCNPVVAVGDRDVVLDLQHPAFRTPLRQVFLDRCSEQFRRYLSDSRGGAAIAGTPAMSPPVPGVIDGVSAAMRQLDSADSGLRFHDAGLAQVHDQLCQPDLSMASQPFVLRVEMLPGKPFRPMASLQNLWLRLQITCLNLKLTTSAKLQASRNAAFFAIPGRLSSRGWVLPIGGSCLLLCGLFATRFRHTVQ